MLRVLLTSFEPFGGLALNSSHETAREVVRRPIPGVELTWRMLPVVMGACVEQVRAAAKEVRPDLLLCLGQAAGAAAIRLEDRGVNLHDFPIPDNAGNQPKKEPILPNGPAMHRTSIPLTPLADALRREGLAVEVSLSAGTYVCNHLYYHLLHHRLPALFVHLPLLPGQVPPKAKSPWLPLEALVAGVRQILVAWHAIFADRVQ